MICMYFCITLHTHYIYTQTQFLFNVHFYFTSILFAVGFFVWIRMDFASNLFAVGFSDMCLFQVSRAEKMVLIASTMPAESRCVTRTDEFI